MEVNFKQACEHQRKLQMRLKIIKLLLKIVILDFSRELLIFKRTINLFDSDSPDESIQQFTNKVVRKKV